jgi:hypothetical protein
LSVLDVRLASIERHLEQAQDPRTWLTKMATTGSLAENLWEFAFERIQDEAGDLEAEIEELRRQLTTGELTESAAWAKYRQVRARSEFVLRECLDLLGGLALRDRATDDQICQLADDLIYECAQPSFKVVATVPALTGGAGDSLTSTLRRVASVRFPDWSLWTVPLVAHEYAFVMTEVEDVLRSHVKSQAAAWVSAQPLPAGSPGEKPEDVREDLRKRAESCARVLLADAFATFTMGPAYACGALLLRLDPADGAHRYRPSDVTRAAMVLGMLKAMDAVAMGAYGEIRTYLEGQWGQMSDLSGPVAPDPLGGVLSPELVSTYLHRKFKYKRTGYAPDGWGVAREWARQWKASLQRRQALTVPTGLVPGHSLRDALNAVWDTQVWINTTMDSAANRDVAVEKVSTVGRELCEELVKRRRPGVGKSLPAAERAGGGV